MVIDQILLIKNGLDKKLKTAFNKRLPNSFLN
jgi:hypothetical protein